MKKLRFLSAFAVILLGVVLFSCKNDEEVLNKNDYPVEILNYVKQHFPNASITGIIKEKENKKDRFDVVLSDRTKLEFNEVKQVIAIDGGKNRLPDSVIPVKILAYVATNYPNQFITEWELEKDRQQVEITDGTDLEFDMEGNFLRIDK